MERELPGVVWGRDLAVGWGDSEVSQAVGTGEARRDE